MHSTLVLIGLTLKKEMDIDMANSKRQMAEDTRKRIAELWNLGWTSSKISEEIGITRNSVVGAIHRLRQKGEILVSAEEKRHKNRKPRPKKILAIRKNMRKPLELGQPVGIMKLTSRSCRFIVAEGGMEETRYCNNPIDKASYCAEHYKICYVPPRRLTELE